MVGREDRGRGETRRIIGACFAEVSNFIDDDGGGGLVDSVSELLVHEVFEVMVDARDDCDGEPLPSDIA